MAKKRISSEDACIDYIAVFEEVGIELSGSGDEVHRWVFDAVPCSVVEEIALLLTDANRAADLPMLSFLMLTIQDHGTLNRLLANLDGHVRVTVSRRSSGADDEILAYAEPATLDREPLSFFIRITATASTSHVSTLEQVAAFKTIPDADDLDVFDVSDHEAAAVAVYDVGQGSLSAIVNEVEHPVIFFDMGWPLSFFPKSLPQNVKFFNPFPAAWVASPPAPVVLSHLDWDHWAYVLKKGRARWDAKRLIWKTEPKYREEALMRPWLMRRPKFKKHALGGSHIHLVQTLAATFVDGSRALHFWPESQTQIYVGALCLFTCVPSGSSSKPSYLRNNEGIGMLVEDADSCAKVLFPGDADYPSIPMFARQCLTGVVAPHHGGAITPESTPNAVGHGRMVMSVFPNSYSNMPHPDVISEAKNSGWKIVMTSERSKCSRWGRKISCGNRLIRLSTTPMCGCDVVPKNCLCISRTY